MHTTPPPRLQACCWLIVCAATGAALIVLFDDSHQQDAALHFLYARWAWNHPLLLVDVWARPLFTVLYAVPALIGHRAARLFSLSISLAIAWQTWRLAQDLGFKRAPFAVALVWMQPSFFLSCAETMTEPIFALVFVIALRLHHRGWIKAGMIVASLMILARPEGFFLGVLWALWQSGVQSTGFSLSQAKACTLNAWPLATGAFLWWIVAWAITGDPLFIKHNWPANWPMTGTEYGAAGWYGYPLRLPEIVGLLLLPPFLFGLIQFLKRKELGTITSSFLLIFLLHTVLRAYGLLGSAGYPRYCVTIAPAIALITLCGWNRLAEKFSHVSRFVRTACAGVIVAMSFYLNFVYADGAEMSRDARAIDSVASWFRLHPQPVTRFIWGQPYACIAFDRDPWEQPAFTRNRANDLQLLRESPAGTLVYWDARIGPSWFGLEAKDFEEAGYVRLYSQSFLLRGYLLDRSWFGFGGPRRQTMHLFYKQLPESHRRQSVDR